MSIKTKKGSPAWKAKLSKAQKAGWKKRREREQSGQRKARQPKPRMKRRAFEEVPVAEFGVGAGPLEAQSTVSDAVAERIKQDWREDNKDVVQAWQNAGGSKTYRWRSGQPNPTNIPKEEGRPYNPDDMFVQPPLRHDPVNHPAHYMRHPSGVECITITEQFNFNRGNAIKYIWRADEKGSTLENLRKAQWYLNREISRLEQEAVK